MLRSIITVAVVVAIGYWYWSGPYQSKVNPTYGEQMRQNSEAMRECIYNKKYAASRMVKNAGHTEEICSRELNLYMEDGQWHSYDDRRSDY